MVGEVLVGNQREGEHDDAYVDCGSAIALEADAPVRLEPGEG